MSARKSSPRCTPRCPSKAGCVGIFRYPDFTDFRDNLDGTGIEDIAVHDWEPYAVSTDGAALRVGGGRVSPNLFDLLGVQPLLGPDVSTRRGRAGRGTGSDPQ